MAKIQFKIQIVDTHRSLETRFNVGFAADSVKINRTRLLAQLEKKRGAKTAFARDYHPPFSELYLRNDAGRSIHFRAWTDCPPELHQAAMRLFDDARDGLLPEARFDEVEPFLMRAAKSGHELCAYDDAPDDFCKITNYEKLKPDLEAVARASGQG